MSCLSFLFYKIRKQKGGTGSVLDRGSWVGTGRREEVAGKRVGG
jgi:hypothetical protein